MAAIKLRLTVSKVIKSHHISNTYSAVQKLLYCTANSSSEEVSNDSKLGFAKFSERQDEFLHPKTVNTKLEHQSFASLLKNSNFIELGDPEGKEVIGTIYHVVDNDLYIDFGWKFPTVCNRPERNRTLYVRGAKVRLLIKELEMASKFLGSDKETTLLEANCVLLGLVRKKSGTVQQPNEGMTTA